MPSDDLYFILRRAILDAADTERELARSRTENDDMRQDLARIAALLPGEPEFDPRANIADAIVSMVARLRRSQNEVKELHRLGHPVAAVKELRLDNGD